MLFLFFSIQGERGGWVLESMENSILFLETFPNEAPNNIPFRGPEAMCNQLVKLNLKKNYKEN